MTEYLKEILSTVIYPAFVAFAWAVVKGVLDKAKVDAREAVVGAVQRQAGTIVLELQKAGLAATSEEGSQMLADLAQHAEQVITGSFQQSLKKLGSPETGTVASMVLGEAGKLLAK